MAEKKIVVIGGGTGTHTVLQGLKRYQPAVELSAIVTMADSGGSTGRLRDEFGFLPVGDVRMALAALARESSEHEQLLRKLFMYRFERGEGLTGHSFGNLLLIALRDILGSEDAAIAAAGEVLQVAGTVIPVTTTPTTLVATYDDGLIVEGEHAIDAPSSERSTHRISQLALSPATTLSPRAAVAIAAADLVVLGPGDLYTSVLANCVVDGMAAALQTTSAKLVYIVNLMTRAGQTHNFTARDHMTEVATYIKRTPEYVIYNTTPLPADLLVKYAAEDEYPVALDITSDPVAISGDFLATDQVVSARGDAVRRSYIRHDSDKLAAALMALV